MAELPVARWIYTSIMAVFAAIGTVQSVQDLIELTEPEEDPFAMHHEGDGQVATQWVALRVSYFPVCGL